MLLNVDDPDKELRRFTAVSHARMALPAGAVTHRQLASHAGQMRIDPRWSPQNQEARGTVKRAAQADRQNMPPPSP